MKNLSIAKKLMIGFGCCFVVTAGLSGVALEKLSTLNENVHAFADNRLPKAAALSRLETDFQSYRGSLYRHNAASVGDVAAADTVVSDARSKVEKSATALSAIVTAPQAKVIAKNIDDRLEALFRRDDVALDLSRRQESEAASQALLNLRNDSAQIGREFEALHDLFSEQEMAAKAEAESDFAKAKLIILIGLLIAIAAVAGALLLMVRLVSRPLNDLSGVIGQIAGGNLNVKLEAEDRRDEVGQLSTSVIRLRDQLLAAERGKEEQANLIVGSIGHGLDALAKGDLTARVTAELSGPFAKLKSDFNDAMQAIETAMRSVSEATNAINSGSADIRQASDDLSQRTEQQAASLEETAAAMHEITETVRQSAEGTTRADAVVTEARNDAQQSGDVVRRAVEAMSGIERSSAEISDIISVIDGIAFQTNLLALNAGVEAARAGDAGKGFAVVASEVRALAQRSADAAKDVKAKITASSEQVEVGVELVSETGKALERIIGRIGEISTLVATIAASAEQQATGLQQVNTAVSEMDGVTQQNAAMVEQATAAARSLANEAAGLAHEVARFRLSGSAHAYPASSGLPVHEMQVRAATAGRQIARSIVRGSSNTAIKVEHDDWSEF